MWRPGCWRWSTILRRVGRQSRAPLLNALRLRCCDNAVSYFDDLGADSRYNNATMSAQALIYDETAALEAAPVDERRRAQNRVGRRRLVACQMELEALRRENATMRAELADARALLPPKFPQGWLNIKNAAELAGCSEPAVYKYFRSGKVLGLKLKGRIRIDPASIKRRGEYKLAG